LKSKLRIESLSGFGDFAGLDAGGADLHPARATLGLLNANRL
jgi:hypothetical protein